MKKERQRYVRYEIFSDRPLEIDGKEMARVLWKTYGYLFGEISSGKAGFWIMEHDEKKQAGVIRCSHLVHDELIVTLTLLTKINDVRVCIDTFKTSGILNKVAG